MARIRIIKVKGRKLAKPKVVYFKRDNLNKYSKKKKGKYDIMVIDRKQKDLVLNNQIRAYSDKIRFHA